MTTLRRFGAALGAVALAAAIAAIAMLPSSRPASSQADVLSGILQRLPKLGAYPPNASPLNASSGNVAAATATATLTSAAGLTTYIFGFDVNGGGATGASIISCTVTGLVGGTATFSLPVAAGATAATTPLVERFPEPLPASATNTNIVVSCPTFGSGNTNATVNAYGFNTALVP